MSAERKGSACRALFGAALLLALVPFRALADGFSGQIEPSLSASRSTSVDQAGQGTFATNQALLQKYRLNVDRSIYPFLRFFGSGLLEKADGTSSGAFEAQPIDSTLTNLAAMLTAGNPVLQLSANGSRREEAGRSILGARNLVNEAANLVVGWRPIGLPVLELRFAYGRNYDTRHVELDTATRDTQFTVRYQTKDKTDISNTFRFANARDFLDRTETDQIGNSLRVMQDGVLFRGRTRFHGTFSLDNRYTRSQVSVDGGLLSTQRFPIVGLSLVEAFPALPTADALVPNPALIDGATGVGASLNIGFSPSGAGDTNFRDVGAQFSDAVTSVNRIFVWVDRALSEPIARAFTFEAYQSSDNESWLQVPVVAPVFFDRLQNRFELSIEPTQATYLKVVTRPLAASVSSDSAFAEIFVTEIQFFEVLPAPDRVVVDSGASQLLTLTARSKLFDSPGVNHDLTVNLGHTSGLREYFTYYVSNTLSADYVWRKQYRLNARVGRHDFDQGTGHEGSFMYGGSVSTSYLPTLRQGLTFSGKMGNTPRGANNTNGVSFFNSAELYRGIGAQAVFGYSVGRIGEITNSTGQINLTTSITPYRTLSLSGSYGYANTHLWRDEVLTVSLNSRLGGSVAYNPFTALSLSGSVYRILPSFSPPRTLASYAVGLSPFPGGELQANFAYAESLDALHEEIVRTLSPTLRWSIRSGTWLEATYTYTVTDSAARYASNHFFNALLMLSL